MCISCVCSKIILSQELVSRGIDELERITQIHKENNQNSIRHLDVDTYYRNRACLIKDKV